jgi:hypothetical protein
MKVLAAIFEKWQRAGFEAFVLKMQVRAAQCSRNVP